ncbi:KamA family radical SAM protein, partial [Candidatus Roizmanbacteria bacterium]|nr:KamA family radical SAM protein [Candidatus Roizmanbacteria bacterium]
MKRDDFVFSLQELREYLQLKNLDVEDDNNFSLLIPKYYINLINWKNKHDPLRKMVMISNLEKQVKDYELTDPIGDKKHAPVSGIVHRHKDRCLLMLTSSCAVHCRFCFRRSMLASNKVHLKQSMQYITDHSELWEVILSGGDPFMLTDSFLQTVIRRLKKIKHIKTIRFHTRVPAVYPQRITESFLRIIRKSHPCTVAIHINHPREITEEFNQAVAKLQKTGAMLLSQTVLMRDINNNVDVLEQLFRQLVETGVKPYYLHHLDMTTGTNHFRISVEEGKNLIQQLRNRMSGICMPEYVIDIPGGYGKVPVMWFHHIAPRKYQAKDFEGRTVVYTDHYSSSYSNRKTKCHP